MKQLKFEDKIGLYLLFFLIMLILIPILFYFSNFEDQNILQFIYISSCGGLGGTIYVIRGFYQHLAANDFKILIGR